MRRTWDRIPTSQGRVNRLLVVGMALGFLALIAAGVAAAWSTGRNEEHTRWVNHTYEVKLAISDLSVAIEQGETARRGFLIAGQPVYLGTYRQATTRLAPAIGRIATLTADNPRQRHNVALLRPLVRAIVAQRNLTIATASGGRVQEAHAQFAGETAFRRMIRFRAITGAMQAEEARLLVIRDADQRSSVHAFYAVLAASGLLVLLVAAICLLTVIRYTQALGRSRDSLAALNETLEEQVDERTADLSRANEEIQRFAYIVSHDLRSPLVNVMGFTAELEAATAPLATLVERAEAEAPGIMTEDARLAAREDLPEAIRFIRTSTQKMDRLINAILKLSREGRRTIAPEPLDLEALCESVIGAIRHVLDDRGVEIAVERPMPRLVSDRVAVEQIVSNLVENASKYQAPGRAARITLSGQLINNRVVISVADNGRGIAATDHERIFDLFRRSGPQDQQGEGIGLAHVRALAYRLGGTIQLESTLGTGSTFRLVLPPSPPAIIHGETA